jgi:hypothetical protein
MKRAGTANAVILAILAVAALVIAAVGLFTSFLVGLFVLPKAPPPVFLYVWDGIVIGFLFCWATGLLADLQRSEALSLEKFLHLPVSPAGVFMLNYLSSLFSLTLIVFVPAMIGLSLGLVFATGPVVLVQLPLLAAFLLTVTALTYQFQGWLASLMVNPRRRRTVIVVATMALVLMSQLPNLFGLLGPSGKTLESELASRLAKERDEWKQSTSGPKTAAGQGTAEKEHQHRKQEIQNAYDLRSQEQNERVERTVRFVNLLLPPGWLPLGATASMKGDVVPALLGTLGLTLMGVASLWRCYRTTVRLYTGQFSSGKRPTARLPAPAKAGESRARVLEKELPWLSEQTSAVALAGFRSLTRAPEAKMMLLTPLILVVVFGAMFLRRSLAPPDAARPLLAFGAIAMILFSMVQFVGNQFGFDRNGFRVFVLCGARRRDILLGKNLACAPLALSLGMLVVALLQVIYPMRLDYFLAVLFQLVSMYLLFCLLANWLSILAPLHIPAGSFRPTNLKGIPLLLQLAFMFLLPPVLAMTLLPLGVQVLLEWLGLAGRVPICLLLSLAECGAVGYVYRLVLTWQGALLQAREQRILEIVTSKAE